MNRRSSAWTGRAPRSLAEAFGPYEAGPIGDRGTRWGAALACALIAVAGMALTLWWA